MRKKLETPSFCQTNDPDKANLQSVIEAERNQPSPSIPMPSGFQSLKSSPQKSSSKAAKPQIFKADSVESPMNKYRESEVEDMKVLESTDYKKASILNPLPSLKSKNLKQDSPPRKNTNDSNQINLTN